MKTTIRFDRKLECRGPNRCAIFFRSILSRQNPLNRHMEQNIFFWPKIQFFEFSAYWTPIGPLLDPYWFYLFYRGSESVFESLEYQHFFRISSRMTLHCRGVAELREKENWDQSHQICLANIEVLQGSYRGPIGFLQAEKLKNWIFCQFLFCCSIWRFRPF